MTISIGVVGAGNIATSRHIPAFQEHDRVSVTSVYDINDSKTRDAANKYGLRPAADLEDLCEFVDLVSLCTPPSTHREQAITALKAGCHVLCEKPMAMTADEADEMIATAEEHNRVLGVVHNFLYMDSIVDAREVIQDGSLGTITRTFMIKPESEEKRGKQYLDQEQAPTDEAYDEWKLYRLFWDEAAHLMYLTRDVLGDITLDRATVTSTSVSSYGTVKARFTADDNSEGNVTMLLDAPISEWWFVIVGTDGVVLVDIYRDIALHFNREPDHSAGRVLKVMLSGLTQAGVGTITSGMGLIKDRYVDGYRIPDAGFSTQIDHMVDAIKHGKPLPTPPTEDREAVAAMQAVVEATPMIDGKNTAKNR